MDTPYKVPAKIRPQILVLAHQWRRLVSNDQFHTGVYLEASESPLERAL